MFKFLKNIGPGTLVAAAFIGPGTVTVCTLAGVKFGFTLLWAMLLSVIATLVLQEMASRIGIITQKGLADVIKEQLTNPLWRKIVIVLMLLAIVFGNAAYEAGNISGGALGLAAVSGASSGGLYPLILGVIAFSLLFFGNYRIIEKVLVALVIVMSLSFITTSIITKPDVTQILQGLFIPKLSGESLLTVVALIGTTVVPYNLFLHASLVKERWHSPSDLKASRKDTLISIVLGGLVSMSIIIAAAAGSLDQVSSATDLAKGLEPLFGSGARYFLGFGLFAAGITSAITAPLAAAYVANSCFGWNASLKDWRFRMVWMIIIGIGVLFSSLKINPIEIIQFAQVANGILLPVIAVMLLWVVNKTTVLGIYKNTLLQNSLSVIITLVAVFLGIRSILKVFNLL